MGVIKQNPLPKTTLVDTEADRSSVKKGRHPDSHEDSDQGKFKAIFGLLKNMIGVKDIVNMRLSLPAQLLDPISNLEQWQYLDRPDFFACLGDDDDPVNRMFGVITWWFSKDLKYIVSRIKKPYNSVLGEQFMSKWEVPATKPGLSLRDIESEPDKVRVIFVAEQTSHHPPVSAFHYECPEKGVSAWGSDHICARFTGTSVKVSSGSYSSGIHVRLANRDNEEYRLTHPTASIQGWLKGSLYITVSEYCTITCPKSGLKAVIEYKEESWLGKPKFLVEGKIFRQNFSDEGAEEPVKLKSIPEDQVVGKVEGSWRGRIYGTRTDNNQSTMLLDMNALQVIPKLVKPISEQNENESRRVWSKVTELIIKKDFNNATKAKHALEDLQRQKASERLASGSAFVPQLFHLDTSRPGYPTLKVPLPDL
ncbi:hypothetical protein K493DRAFT_316390 [Basidiobolus meristosporus CBS 931.73]|uniref:Oxysterol-binding protein n=1 Tax=Basidiobolus meristosporus CBS 931.73 TaxID=1314790 RepID=A0A1Y1Y448_9FUNG|nr:hypothetical protein K493DRAFT_316390 [Basidiobolus meristosporus CBS 931.73]|eukprot:ORX92753.1 hypothetical protein K493DRAFT_316390 [Basidiobolus meristosporus CBS 931.73]